MARRNGQQAPRHVRADEVIEQWCSSLQCQSLLLARIGGLPERSRLSATEGKPDGWRAAPEPSLRMKRRRGGLRLPASVDFATDDNDVVAADGVIAPRECAGRRESGVCDDNDRRDGKKGFAQQHWMSPVETGLRWIASMCLTPRARRSTAHAPFERNVTAVTEVWRDAWASWG
jgi:hypothetical protein